MTLCARWGGLLAGLAWVMQAHAALPQVGPVDVDFAGVDQVAQTYLSTYNMPGVSVVVAYRDRIIYAQGYGYADREQAIPTSPWLEYRLASVSKPLTATAVMRLYEQGKVQLDAPAWNYVAAFMGAEPKDPRVKQVTVRQLLTHSWGLDRATAQDPMGSWYPDANGKPLTSSRDVLRHVLLGMTLSFNPGARYAYNNTGFCWLQLIVETLDGRPLDTQLTAMLGPEPLSQGRVRIGEVNPTKVTLAEPTYYDKEGASLGPPVPGVYGPPAPALVAAPYGGYTLQGYGGAGGLIASPFTVTRWLQRLIGLRPPALLQPATVATMLTEQPLADGTRYAGLGIEVIPAYQSDQSLTYTGSISGTRTAFIATPRAPGGPKLLVVAFINGSRAVPNNGIDNIGAELLTPLVFAVDKVKGYGTKPEITGERLIATPSATDAYYSDLLFNWAQRTFSDLFPTNPPTQATDGYLYRYYSSSGIYVGTKEGRVWLYIPSINPAEIISKGAMVDHLPLAIQETDALKQGQRAPSGPSQARR